MKQHLQHRRGANASQQLSAQPSSPDSMENDSEENEDESSPSQEMRGRKRTKLKKPPNGQQVPIKPFGDEQFQFVDPGIDASAIGGQITALLKHEYLSIIAEKNPAGKIVKKRHAANWMDYNVTEDDNGLTAADRVKAEFWSMYSVDEGEIAEAERIFEKFAAKQCRQMMYRARIDAIKKYHKLILKKPIKDSIACREQLTLNQYLKGQPDWCMDAPWKSLCAYWCSAGYKKKREAGQELCLKSDDIAQNRGGSRPFGDTMKYSCEAAAHINTYCCMKSGVKNCDSSGGSGPISCHKAQKDDYFRGLQTA